MGDQLRGIIAWLFVSVLIFLVSVMMIDALISVAQFLGWPYWAIIYATSMGCSLVLGYRVVTR